MPYDASAILASAARINYQPEPALLELLVWLAIGGENKEATGHADGQY